MSKRINVNPDHYKVAGRERPGNPIAKAPKEVGQDERARTRWAERMRAKGTTPSPKSRRRG